MTTRRWLGVAAGVLVMAPGLASTYPITPLTPPAGYEYLRVALLITLVVANIWALWRLRFAHPGWAPLRVLGAVLLFAAPVWVIVRMTNTCTYMGLPLVSGGRLWATLPPSQGLAHFVSTNFCLFLCFTGCMLLASGQSHLWQRLWHNWPTKTPHWQRVIVILIASFMALVILLVFLSPVFLALVAAVALFDAALRQPRILLLLLVNLAVWLIFLLPFTLSGVYVQMLGGGYRCQKTQEDLARDLVRYALTNEGQLPNEEFSYAVFDRVFAHVVEVYYYPGSKYTPKYTCPAARWLHGMPADYHFNKNLWGCLLKDVEALDPPQPIFLCPVDDGTEGTQRVVILTDKLRAMEAELDSDLKQRKKK
jgi:hypothetical protein